MRLTLILLPALAACIPLTITQYASTCSARGSAIYTSGSLTYTLPITQSTATPTPHVDLCPAYNGRNYTTPSSGAYSVHCDLAITGTRLSNIQSRQANVTTSSQQSCITACQEHTACVAINLGPASCEYFSNVTGTADAPGFAALIIVKRLRFAMTADSSAVSERTIVSTMVVSVPYTTTVISQRITTVVSTSISLVPTTIVSSIVSTALSTVLTTSVSTYVSTVDRTIFVTATTAIPTTIITTELVTPVKTTTSLVPTTIVSTSTSSYPVTTFLVIPTTSMVPTTLVQTHNVTITTTVNLTATTTSSSAVAETPTMITLPNNLGTQFGGVDITKGFASLDFIRPGLFNLGGLPLAQYENRTIEDSTGGQRNYQIPEFLDFTWASQLKTETVTGETKHLYQYNLSQSYSTTLAFNGFGGEIQDSFQESSLGETYKKYASIYARQQTYYVTVREYAAELQAYLSPRALSLFKAGDPKAIVDTFGTHYMTSATFGGMKRLSSTLDARDDNLSLKLGQALEAKFAAQTGAGEVSGGAGSDNSDAIVQKISTLMEDKSFVVFGGTYVDGSEDAWISSLYSNPAALNFELANLADLIPDSTLKTAVQAEIDSRVQTSAVTSTALALVMWEYLGNMRTDAGSGAHARLSTASTTPKQDWYTLGQYGLGSYDWNPALSKGLLIRNLPGSTQDFVIKPDNIEYRWGKSNNWGLSEMVSSNTSYYALSGFWYNTDYASFDYLEYDRAGMVHESITLPATDGGQLWNDAGSGANDDANVHSVYYGPDAIIQLADGQPEAYFFPTNQDTSTFRKLDFSKVQFVSNTFINPSPT
ncbi:hypothetical protein LTR56_014656 [Elasticomyces elasticus]|nr:hypothetical protein LTR56_014656 [Elasticomyces elasticus]KAK3645333.1 hypothetical protein LTR22_014798 [Elasticomyces elasticus]KAK5750104.1 hypothetical protein LTS12_019830 [Elasticomyces elasticus]